MLSCEEMYSEAFSQSICCIPKALIRRPSASSTVVLNDGSKLICLIACTGWAINKFSGKQPSSIIDRIKAVVPNLRNVAYWLIFASPAITWSLRYFSASQWGSSLVFTIGRFIVVSRPMTSSKKSDLWLMISTGVGWTSGRLSANFPCATENLPWYKMGRNHCGKLRKRNFTTHQIVFVTSITVAFAIWVVFK